LIYYSYLDLVNTILQKYQAENKGNLNNLGLNSKMSENSENQKNTFMATILI